MKAPQPQRLQQSVPGLWRILHRLWPYIRRSRALLAGSFAALAAEILLRLLEPWPLKIIFDRIIHHRHPHGGLHFHVLDQFNSSTLLTGAAIMLVAFAAIRALAEYLNNVGFAVVGNRVLSELRFALYRHLQCLSLSFHNRSRSGDLILRVMSDVSVLTDVTVTAGMPLFGNVLIMCGMVASMMWLNWRLGLIALTALPLCGLVVIRLSRRVVDVSRRQRQREGAMAANAAETMGAIKTVQAFALGDTFADQFSVDNAHSLDDSIKASRLSGSIGRTLDLMIASVSAIVLWFGAYSVIRGELTAGDLIVFLAYLRNCFRPLKDFGKYSTRLAKAAVAGERALSLLDQEPAVHDLPGACDAPRLRGKISFKQVSFAYLPGRPVLRDISFDVRPGERVALVGPSGSGKSTLVSLLLRLYDVGSGTITTDDTDIRKYTINSLRGQISIVLQDSVLFAASLRDNIAYGASNATTEEIEAAARLANADSFIEALPEGYETIVGEHGATLSGGQRQRIAIARAAVRRAPILILDEPTHGLDREASAAVIDALKRLSRGCTSFLVTHTLELVADAGLVLYLEDGRIVERGTHDSLLGLGGRYARMFGMRAASEDAVRPPALVSSSASESGVGDGEITRSAGRAIGQ
ncbi:MAG TPA: ABC transporter ATP-binding protein [Candidatus Binataceae bacterium]|nr:ABC transporter ATP-binding protein [Candidatus Binataceae bacterium]